MLSPPRPNDEEELHFTAFNCHMQIMAKQSLTTDLCYSLWWPYYYWGKLCCAGLNEKGYSTYTRILKAVSFSTNFLHKEQTISVHSSGSSKARKIFVDNEAWGDNPFKERL